MKADFDIAVIGSGFAGSLMAMIARRLGHSVILIERGRHPRFVIGESSTPLANLLLENLARRYELPRLLPLTKWGPWQKTFPRIGCGLKRGFTFYHHRWDEPFCDDAQHQRQLLVAASPRNDVADTHWYRPDFDHFLVLEAQTLGVEYLDQTRLESARLGHPRSRLEGTRLNRSFSVTARFIVDATGPRGFLHRALGLAELSLAPLPSNQALFTHFSNVRRWEEIFPTEEPPPYPVDDAAVHHVFDGGWVWVLRFNNGVTSAGIAATPALARKLRFDQGAKAWSCLLQRLPSLADQFATAETLLPFMRLTRLPFLSERAAARSWALLPSAAGFVDPLLSTGFPLTLLGIARLAEAIELDWQGRRWSARLKAYQRQTLAELRATARLVAALYSQMHDFDLFIPLALLYFAAASFSEAARRLGKPELARSFLLLDHPDFGACLRSCTRAAAHPLSPTGRSALIEAIYAAIAPVDVAGLGDRTRRNWHPAPAEDLL